MDRTLVRIPEEKLGITLAPPLRGMSMEKIVAALDKGWARLTPEGMVVPVVSGGATAPAFAATPNCSGATANGTLDTSLTAPTHTATIFTAGASGSKVDEIRMLGLGTTAAGVINIFRARSGTFFLLDQILVGVVTSSATAIAFSAVRTYENMILMNGDTIQFAVTVAGLQSLIEGSAFGGDF